MKKATIMWTVLTAAVLCIFLQGTSFATVTGNPEADGWTFGGHSLENGVYVRNSANYGFNTYRTQITIASGSQLNIADGTYSWNAGDNVLGLGGEFASITASEAGWSAFTGNGVNSILGEDTKFVTKFGTANATFAASTVAPDAGDGLGSLGTNGGTGAVQVRSTGWFYAADWIAGSGQLMRLNKTDHIERVGTSAPDDHVARLMWLWDGTSHVASWEILLNTSLLDRLAPSGFAGLTPTAGDLAIIAVQRRDGVYTDALVTVVPEPATICLLGLGGLALLRKRRA
ncbi:PEP-CTERM sorting domain-containing protein [bacterium]|nr:MAG: PEP-CTERM sorting domain-containing protein [bacterium]